MLIKILLYPIWALVDMLVGLLPAPMLESAVNSSIYNLLANGIYIMGRDNFINIITSVLAWTLIQITWSVIEWTYKKIPGVS